MTGAAIVIGLVLCALGQPAIGLSLMLAGVLWSGARTPYE